MNAAPTQFVPHLIAINLTRRCNLNCPHCYMDAQQRRITPEGEVTLSELSSLFGEIARRAPGTITVLTGGEPLLYPEIDALVEAGAAAGLRMVMGTNGVLLTELRIERFKRFGLAGVGISLDSVRPEQHDAFRGMSGSFDRTCQAIRLCARHDLRAQVHFTVTQHNDRQLDQAVDLAKDLGASIINFFFLVCVGRGTSRLDLPAGRYESALTEIAGLQQRHRDIMVQSRCTPHFKRILYENNPDSPYTRATGYDGGGCPAAVHYCRIDPRGEVTPCPYMELSAGNIREQPFWSIWDEAALFKSLRNPTLLRGRCSSCEFKLLCGGCRARSLAQSGNLMAEDPNCAYVPRGVPVIPAAGDSPFQTALWTPEAMARLADIPVFLRERVKCKLEERARRDGVSITPELMKKHKQEREKELGFTHA